MFSCNQSNLGMILSYQRNPFCRLMWLFTFRFVYAKLNNVPAVLHVLSSIVLCTSWKIKNLRKFIMKEYAKCENSFRTRLAFSVALDLPI